MLPGLVEVVQFCALNAGKRSRQLTGFAGKALTALCVLVFALMSLAYFAFSMSAFRDGNPQWLWLDRGLVFALTVILLRGLATRSMSFKSFDQKLAAILFAGISAAVTLIGGGLFLAGLAQ